MKILMISPVFDAGGTETYIENLATGLIELGHCVKVCSGGGLRVPQLKDMGIEHILIEQLRSKSIIFALKSISLLCSQIKHNTPDIIHTSSVYTTFLAKIANIFTFFTVKPRPKIILTLHGGPTRDLEKRSATLLKCLNTKIIVLNRKSKNALQQYGLKAKSLFLVYNGVDTLKLKQLSLKIANHPLVTPIQQKSKIVLGYFGRLSEEKGILHLVHTMNFITKINKDIVLLIVGTGPCAKKVNDYINTNNLEPHIKMIGFRSDQYHIMNACDIIVLPSHWDMAPMVLLEAMALGKQILATSVGGIPEILSDTGNLVAPGNETLLAEAILQMVKEKKYAVRNYAAQSRVEEFFSLDSMVKNTEQIYIKVRYSL